MLEVVGSLCTVVFFFLSVAAPGPPSNVNLRIATSESLYLSWEEPEEPNGNITQYNYSCYIANNVDMVVQEASLGSEARSVLIIGSGVGGGIIPFTFYTCSVTAFTSGGAGESASATTRSASAGEGTILATSFLKNLVHLCCWTQCLSLQWYTVYKCNVQKGQPFFLLVFTVAMMFKLHKVDKGIRIMDMDKMKLHKID